MPFFCPFCGEELIDGAKFCKNCGKNVENYKNISNETANPNTYQPPVSENSHTIATVIGFICAVLFPLIGIIIGIYLATRKDSPNAKKYGTIIIILGAAVWILSIIVTVMMY